MKLLALWMSICILTVGRAETLVSEAKVVQRDERGFILHVGTQPLAAEDSYQTRFWKDRAPAKREAFKEGDHVVARIKTDADPPQIRELADRATAAWLDGIRKTVKKGTVAKVDAKYVTLRFADGSSFSYRATDKTKISLEGKDATLGSLTEGTDVYAKGRLLPTLDTFLVEVSDRAPAAAAKPTKKPTKEKLQPLKAEGRLEGRVMKVHGGISMFDIETDRLLHITYTATTKFTLDGEASGKEGLRVQLRAKITYRRDAAGRVIASNVDLFSR